MRKLLTILIALFTVAITANAQSAGYDEFPIKVTSGLTNNSIINQYYWDSPYYTFEKPVEGVRITILKNNTNQSYNGFPMVAIAELTVYDRKYNVQKYPIEKITTNSLERSEGALAYIADGIWDTYYHSAWKYATITPEDYVYIDIQFATPLSTFALTLVSRNERIAPEEIVITPTGVQYDGTAEEGGGESGGGESGGNNNPGGGTPEGNVKLQPVDVFSDSICFVYLKNGGIDAYQRSFMSGDSYQQEGTLYIPLSDGTIIEYPAAAYDSCSSTVPQLPTLSTYKFNNKYNANLNIDAIADTISDTIRFALNAIGKSLTASFNLSDERAIAYIDTTLQISKETRTRFDGPINYVATYPGYNIIQNIKVKDEVWDYGEESVEEIPLRADMLYTNKPSEVGDELANMLDQDPATVFHSVFGASYDASVLPYITIELDKAVRQLKFYYMTRTTGNYNPTGLALYACNDNENWTPVAQYSTADGLPIDPAGAEFTSPTIDLGAEYKYLKIEQTSSEYHNNHMVFAEFRLFEVTPGSNEPTKVEDAVYKRVKIPFGRIYTVDIDWLTDRANAVPRIDIDVEGGYSITSKEYYRKANFRITGYGVYEDFEDSVQIKGRGNSTWGYPKKPYRLKFDKKKKPFGLTNGKSWVLLANYQRGSLMANAIAIKVGQLTEAPYTNHIIPVEVYLNGQYMGSYMFTEKVGFANNSVDIDEDLGTGYMLELDDYYDEAFKFKSDSYRLPVNIKEPDLTELEEGEAMQKFFNIQGDFNRFETSLYNNGRISDMLDLDAAARFMLANDLVMNQEIGHPKSTYLWREDYTSADSKIVFGPLWDFDWAFGYEGTSSYCTASATQSVLSMNMYSKAGYRFFQDLMNNEEFKRHYLKVWKEFAQKGYINELIEFMDDYYNFAKSSFENNYYVWGDGIGYDASIDRMQQWMRERHDYILANLDNVDITDILYTLLGDVDCNNQLTVHDVAMTVSYLAGKSDAAFNAVKADIDESGSINDDDALLTASQVAAADAVSSLYYFNTPVAGALLSAESIEAPIGENAELPVSLTTLGGSGYKAIQMDIELPVGSTLVEAVTGESTADASFLFNQTDEQSYRIVAYMPNNDTFYEGDAIAKLSLNVSEIIPEEQRSIKFTNILAIDEENTELRIDNLEARFGLTTGISTEAATIGISGGKQLTISLLKAQTVDIYAVDGRKVRTIEAAEGTTRVQLPAGIYVVEGKKVIIR